MASSRPPFRRTESLEAKPPAKWYIKGSFVLDYVFNRSCARDIDVFFDRSCEKPSKEEISLLLDKIQIKTKKPFDIHGVDDFDACDGGSPPVVNIERWHIRNDGCLYTIKETNIPRTECSGKIPGIQGVPLYETKIEKITKDWAASQKLELLSCSSLPYEASYLSKLLEKMKNHPELNSDDVRTQVQEILEDDEKTDGGFELSTERGSPSPYNPHPSSCSVPFMF